MSPLAPTAAPSALGLTSASLCQWYFPSTGLGCSLLIHGIVLILLVVLFPAVEHPPEPIPPFEPAGGDGGGRLVIYLPAVGGGGGRGGGRDGGGAPGSGGTPSMAGSERRGLVYPGPQVIRSNPPRPTNRFQTLLQPDLENPPTLSPPLGLPNLVMTADSGPAPRPKPAVSDFVLPRPARAGSAQARFAATRLEDPQPRSALRLPTLEMIAAGDLIPPLGPAKPPVGLGDPDEPERMRPLTPTLGAVPKPPPPQPEDLPIQRRSPRLPHAAPEVKLARSPQLENPPRPAAALEGVQPLEPVSPSREIVVEPTVMPDLTPRESVPLEGPEVVAKTTLPSRGTDARTVLALTPAPTVAEQEIQIPQGEARGLFTISPEPNLDPAETEPGSPFKTTDPPPPPAPGEAGMSGSGLGPPGAGPSGGAGGNQGPGAGTGTGSGSGSGSGLGSGSGTGSGSGSGSGTGSGGGSGGGSGSGSGPGSGAGTGPGEGPFAGITIVGGTGGDSIPGGGGGSGSGGGPLSGVTTLGGIGTGPGPGGSVKTALPGITTIGGFETNDPPKNAPRKSQIARPLRTRYELFVLSSERGGGGLPNLGVFGNQQIKTVYLDMRQDEADPEALWTLEFAMPRETSMPADPAEELDAGRQGFVLPFPALKGRPHLPPDLVARYAGRMVIVYMVINVEGKPEQLAVKETPDPTLNAPVLDALSRWVFRPGTHRGQPVPVQALLGIPLAAP